MDLEFKMVLCHCVQTQPCARGAGLPHLVAHNSPVQSVLPEAVEVSVEVFISMGLVCYT